MTNKITEVNDVFYKIKYIIFIKYIINFSDFFGHVNNKNKYFVHCWKNRMQTIISWGLPVKQPDCLQRGNCWLTWTFVSVPVLVSCAVPWTITGVALTRLFSYKYYYVDSLYETFNYHPEIDFAIILHVFSFMQMDVHPKVRG